MKSYLEQIIPSDFNCSVNASICFLWEGERESQRRSREMPKMGYIDITQHS